MKNVKFVHLEISSHCQASCPACVRETDYNKNLSFYFDQRNLTREELISAFSSNFLNNLEEFFLGGNHGDPLANPHLVNWIKYIKRNYPHIGFWIHTNGGLGSRENWVDLASLLKKGNRVCFSIDGLEDTNHIYRKGVEWKRIMSNAKAFIDNGGLARWKFIAFPHNIHQIEEARALSEEMGFYEFVVDQPYREDYDYLDKNFKASEAKSFSSLSSSELGFVLNKNEARINCDALERKAIYVDCDLNVWPCCWLGIDTKRREGSPMREELYRILNQKFRYEVGFNNLSQFPIESILNHRFFTNDLFQLWSGGSTTPKTCQIKCGTCS